MIKKINPIVAWLISVAVLVVVIVVVGGITRLSDAGLSMVHWEPLKGILPPLTQVQWAAEFAAYQQYPEFQKLNQSMTLYQFKNIFFWEYLHRIIGRIIGLIILLPYLYFFFKNKLNPPLKKRGAIMIVLVIAQGLMGWYMVQSGLVDRPDVSHFRLAAHLLLALFLLQYVLWTLYDLVIKNRNPNQSLFKWSCGFLTLLTVQLIYGAFVSGLKAGYGFNTFPKMGEVWLPEATLMLPSFFNNLVNNPAMIQFIHRSLAWALLIYVGVFFVQARNAKLTLLQIRSFRFLLYFVAIQFLLGVMTLINFVPFNLALLHQFGGMMLLSCAVFLCYQFTPHFDP